MLGTMFVEATVLDVEHRSGSFTPDGESEARSFDFWAVYVLLGRDTIILRIKPQDDVQIPQVGDRIACEVVVPRGTRVTIRRHLDAPKPAAKAS